MIFGNKKISVRQMQALFITEVFGTAVVFMPSEVWRLTEGKGILSVILGTLPLLLIAVIIGLIYRGQGGSFGETVKRRFGAACNIVFILFWVKIVLITGLWLKSFSEIIAATLLPHIPYQIISAALAVICFYFAQKDIEVRGRTAEIILEFMAIFFIPLLIIVALGADYGNLLPFYGFDLGATGKAAFYVFAALGSADYLLFIYPKTESKESRAKGALTAVIVVGALLTVTTATVYGVFGETVMKKAWPVLNMMDTVDFPGAFIERQDVLMIGFWILSFFIYISGGITYGAYLIEELTGKKSFFAEGLIIFAVSVLPFPPVITLSRLMTYTTVIFLIILPLCLLAAKRKEKGGDRA